MCYGAHCIATAHTGIAGSTAGALLSTCCQSILKTCVCVCVCICVRRGDTVTFSKSGQAPIVKSFQPVCVMTAGWAGVQPGKARMRICRQEHAFVMWIEAVSDRLLERHAVHRLHVAIIPRARERSPCTPRRYRPSSRPLKPACLWAHASCLLQHGARRVTPPTQLSTAERHVGQRHRAQHSHRLPSALVRAQD